VHCRRSQYGVESAAEAFGPAVVGQLPGENLDPVVAGKGVAGQIEQQRVDVDGNNPGGREAIQHPPGDRTGSARQVQYPGWRPRELLDMVQHQPEAQFPLVHGWPADSPSSF
jgi:hypothetical protein